MTDPLRSGRPPASADPSERDRDAQIEELLLTGLDHYFAGQHELAMNVWTRVLFIDRGHARARAYIERARGAVAERQRKGDELLHTGSAAFDRGDAAAARRLVASAVEHGASPDEALALLARIDRLDIPAVRPEPVPRRSEPRTGRGPAAAAVAPGARWKWIGAGVAAGLLVSVLAFAVVLQGGLANWLVLGEVDQPSSTLRAPLPVPSIAEVALSRAESLHARGHLHEALTALQGVATGDPLRPRAEALTATIQRQLLAAARSADRSQPAADPRRP